MMLFMRVRGRGKPCLKIRRLLCSMFPSVERDLIGCSCISAATLQGINFKAIQRTPPILDPPLSSLLHAWTVGPSNPASQPNTFIFNFIKFMMSYHSISITILIYPVQINKILKFIFTFLTNKILKILFHIISKLFLFHTLSHILCHLS